MHDVKVSADVAFTELEEAFFRAGDQMSEGAPVELLSDDVDVSHPRWSPWRWLVEGLRGGVRMLAPAPSR